MKKGDKVEFILFSERTFGEIHRVNRKDKTFDIKAEIIDKNGYKVPVFEVKVKKNIVLHDQNQDLLKQENETISVDGVNGPALILGSLTEVSTNGNWPTIFDAAKQ